MRKVALGIALLLSSTAIAQTTADTDANADMDVSAQTDMTTDPDVTTEADMTTSADVTTTHTDVTHSSTMQSGTTLASNTMPASGPVVQPSNANPEHDARGIAVISAPAVVPAGWNGVAGTAVGGPLVDPATGETVDAVDNSYPACTASVTDNCLQTYERGRSAS